MRARPTLVHPDGTDRFGIHTITIDDVAWLIVQGRGDASTIPELQTALARVELIGAEAVHIDVSRLLSADVDTIRHLAAFARRARRTGCLVQTTGARASLRQAAGILAFDVDLGLL